VDRHIVVPKQNHFMMPPQKHVQLRQRLPKQAKQAPLGIQQVVEEQVHHGRLKMEL
jgi:hypothetical protein